MNTRRTFLQRGAAVGAVSLLASPALGELGSIGGGAAATAAQRRRLLGGGTFADGILSGEPSVDGIILWSRLVGAEGSGSLQLEVAKDRDFKRLVGRPKTIKTSGAVNHTAKVKLSGLAPHEQYYYRFYSANSESVVGRFRTALPPDSHETVRFAFWSCQDFTNGYYNAHDLMAQEDLDFVLNLGDYIYGDRQGAPESSVRRDPVAQAKTLDQYRAKYSLVRTDPALRRMHAQFPVISIWDDHEVKDNYVGTRPDLKGINAKMRDSAYQAFFEAMPLSPTGAGKYGLYRAARYGANVELMMLDDRQYRDAQPCNDANFLDPAACSELSSPRKFLGPQQLDFVTERMTTSSATWKCIANQMMAMPLQIKGRLVDVDSWAGYPQERNDLLRQLQQAGTKDVVFFTGDIHAFFAGEVRLPDGTPIASEFVGGSITSRGLPSAGIGDAVRSASPWISFADMVNKGFGVAEASSSELNVRFRMPATIGRRSRKALPDVKFRVHRGNAVPERI